MTVTTLYLVSLTVISSVIIIGNTVSYCFDKWLKFKQQQRDENMYFLHSYPKNYSNGVTDDDIE